MVQAIVDFDSLIEYTKRNFHLYTDRVRACKICGADASLYGLLDFNKVCGAPSNFLDLPSGVPVYFRKCQACEFIFTELFDDFSPKMWEGLVYNPRYYSEVDPEYNTLRPKLTAESMDALLMPQVRNLRCLDYGAGNGLMSRYLSSRGFVFDAYDPYGLTTMKPENAGTYNFCTSIEVAEHTPDPVGYMTDIVRLCTKGQLGIIISTQVHDGLLQDGNLTSWWYAAPRNGHISLYSKRSLRHLAEKFSLDCFSLTRGTHFISRGYERSQVMSMFLKGRLRGRVRRLLGRVPSFESQ